MANNVETQSVEATTVEEETMIADVPSAIDETMVQQGPAAAAATIHSVSHKRQAKGKAKGKAKGRANGKGKGRAARAKGKAKGKAKGRAKREADAPAAAAGEKVKESTTKGKASFTTKLLGGLGDRDVEEVVAESLKEIEACTAAVADAEKNEHVFDAEIASAKKTMEDAALVVEVASQKEARALDKLKVARLAKGTAAVGTRQVEAEIAECMKVLKILELELASRDKVKELEEAKQAAIAAAEAARQALEESKLKEKEAQDALKASLAKQREEEVQVLKHGQVDKVGADVRKERRMAERAAHREAQAEIAACERERARREKERQQHWREACGLKRGRQLQALTLDVEETPQCSAPATVEASPAKAPKTSESA